MSAFVRASVGIRVNPVKWLLGFYIIFAFGFISLMSPLRAIGAFEPGLLRNATLPPLLLLLILATGLGQLFRPRTNLQIAIIVVFFLCAGVGLVNVQNEDALRPYLSHLYQLISAYCLVAVGYKNYNKVHEKFWTPIAWFVLILSIVSTFITIRLLDQGEIGRYYAPAYGFILVFAVGSAYSGRLSIISILAALISNKRGVIAAMAATIVMNFRSSVKVNNKHNNKRIYKTLVIGLVVIIAMAASSLALVRWAENPDNATSAVGKVVNISYGRMRDTVFPKEGETLNSLSSGRVGEIKAAWASIEGIHFLLGRGAGATVSIGHRDVQNIHFTPLSLTMVFGLPAALLIYLSLGSLILKASSRKERMDLTATERIAPAYLTGALVHSLFAYSLFIDWLVFFFAGVILASLKYDRHRALAAAT